MKQTAVEWLVQQLSKEWILEDRDLYLIEQAKEMEKEQRIKDIDFGHGNPSWVNINYETYFELSNKHELNKSE